MPNDELKEFEEKMTEKLSGSIDLDKYNKYDVKRGFRDNDGLGAY